MNEIWKDIAGFEGYQVSNLGSVRSLNYNHTGRTQILKPQKNGMGYLFVTLCKDGKTKMFKIHRLVAKAFLQNPRNWPEVNHINEDKTDNHVDNLEFCSHKYNLTYGTCQKRGHAKLKNGPLSKPVLQFDGAGKLVKKWPSAHEVERTLGFHASAICRCCRGEYKQAHGYIWKYGD